VDICCIGGAYYIVGIVEYVEGTDVVLASSMVAMVFNSSSASSIYKSPHIDVSLTPIFFYQNDTFEEGQDRLLHLSLAGI
jgi:hypothetical protein